MSRYNEIERQTNIRRRMLANGYTPLANIDKMCVLPGWGTMTVDEALIDEWSDMTKYRATGMRIENGLVALDFDIDDDLALREIERAVRVERKDFFRRVVQNAPMRFGRGEKYMLLARLAEGEEPFTRIASAAYMRPGEDALQRLEVFGGRGARQFGVYGAHSLRQDGQVAVWYEWASNTGPADVPIGDLPVITEEEVLWLCQLVSETLEGLGWTRHLRSQAGKTTERVQYDLADQVFETRDHGEVSLAELEALCAAGEVRLSASWLEGPEAVNSSRCIASLHPRDGRLSILETAAWVIHRPKALEPRPMGEALAGRMERLAAAAGASTFFSGGASGGAAEAAREGVAEQAGGVLDVGVETLLANYALCPSEQRPVVPLDGCGFDAAMTLANFRALMKPYSVVTVGRRGGVTETNPVDLWLADERRVVVAGARFLPWSSERLVDLPDVGVVVNTFGGLPSSVPLTEAERAAALAVWDRFLRHLVPDARERAWLEMWLAAKVQRPWVPNCGVIMQTPTQGTGRSTLFDMMRAVLGSGVTAVTSTQLLGGQGQGQYTDWLADALLVTCDEVLAGDDAGGAMAWKRREAYERLKVLVDPRVRDVMIVRKGLSNYLATVYASFLLATNNANALPITAEDRRWAVLRNTLVKLPAADGGALMAALAPWRRAQGSGFSDAFGTALREHLLALPVAAEELRDAPEWLVGRSEMLVANRGDLEDVLDDVLAEVPGDFASSHALRQRLQHAIVGQGLEASLKNWWTRAADALGRPNPHGWRKMVTRQAVGVGGGGAKAAQATVYYRVDGGGESAWAAMSWAERATQLARAADMNSTRSRPSSLLSNTAFSVVEGGMVADHPTNNELSGSDLTDT